MNKPGNGWCTEEKYIAQNGEYCPKCGKDNITGGVFEASEHGGTHEARCNACGAEWFDCFLRVGYSRRNRMKELLKKTLQDMVESCEYVPASELVPEDWVGWFWSIIADNAPFSWGDNNRTLIDMTTFYNHVDDRLEESDFAPTQWKEIERWKKWLTEIADEAGGVVYIDMEN
jgi:hypothetical protein